MRISEWAEKFNLTVRRAIVTPGSGVYRIKDIFTTRDGSWEPSAKPGSVTQWARDAYLRNDFDDAGADHHLFGAAMKAGKFEPARVHFWTHTDNGNHVYAPTKNSGWANIPMFGGSSYVPRIDPALDRDETGPWAWTIDGIPADVVVGGGMPFKWHVSMFTVWEYAIEDGTAMPPPSGNLEVRVATLEQEVMTLKRLLGQWVGDS